MTQLKVSFQLAYFLAKYMRSGVSCIKNVHHRSYFFCQEKEKVRYWAFLHDLKHSKTLKEELCPFYEWCIKKLK